MTKTHPDDLIAVAAELLDKGGPSAVTLRAVGQAAGVSRGAPYRHFDSKQELLAAVASRELDRLTDAFEHGGEGSQPLGVRETAMAYLKWALEYPERFRLAFGRWETDDLSLGASTARTRKVFMEAVTLAQQCGELPSGDPLRLGVLLLSTVHGIADLALAGHLQPRRAGQANAQDLLDDFFSYLGPAAGGARSTG